MSLVLVGGKIVTPFRVLNPGTVIIKDDKIYEIGMEDNIHLVDDAEVIDCSGKIITPGFVDLLVHGGAGCGFADEKDESIEVVSRYFLEHGSTTMLASLFAKPREILLNDIRRLADYILEHPETNIRGIHMEGPYLNPGLKGAMNEGYLWKPTVESWNAMWEASRGLIKLMTIAPELPGATEVMREASFRGVVLSIGHSMANYEQVDLAINNGAAHVTHMFNAMKAFHHREPGVALGALLRNELKIELIADTLHVHPAVMEFLLKVKGSNGIILVSDSIRAGGMHEGEYEFADQKVIMKNQRATLPNGTLAGSTLTLNKAIKNIVETANGKITDAVRMASLNGAKVVSMEHTRGVLSSGRMADLVVMDSDYEVDMTIQSGKIVYQREVKY